jgi:hypothetical protein
MGYSSLTGKFQIPIFNGQNRIKNERPTSNIKRPTSNEDTPSAFQFYQKSGAKRHPHSMFDVERSMFDVHLYSKSPLGMTKA